MAQTNHRGPSGFSDHEVGSLLASRRAPFCPKPPLPPQADLIAAFIDGVKLIEKSSLVQTFKCVEERSWSGRKQELNVHSLTMFGQEPALLDHEA